MPVDSDEALDIADELNMTADELRKRLRKERRGGTSTPAEIQKMEESFDKVVTLSMMVRTEAVGLALEESALSVNSLKRATSRARRAVKTLQTIATVINIATKIVELAGAIISKDPINVARKSGELLTLANNALNAPAAADA